ncbi:MAG: hypothetical protein ABSA53_37410 [Streptosporangiaceae bacterium]|jgi:hypothetical protein
MARTHLAITAELVSGGQHAALWPQPGRIMIASRSATFEQFAESVDNAFGRWDRSHLHEFTLAEGTSISPAKWWDGDEPEGSLDGSKARLGRLRCGDQFAYVFDLGDAWHISAPWLLDWPTRWRPSAPSRTGRLPWFGWGDIPDQYGRRDPVALNAGCVPRGISVLLCD